MFSALSDPIVIAIFAAASVVVLLVGSRITGLADRIADHTGWGEAVVGGIVLGAATSLSGTVVSVTSALGGEASLAFSNGIGGIAAQTAFLALADVIYRKANLEHSAAEAVNLFQGALLVLLLSLPLVAFTLPDFSIFAVHPVSVLMIGAYLVGARAAGAVHEKPMWRPVQTRETRNDEPEEEPDRGSLKTLAFWFALMVAVLGVTGWVIAQTAVELSQRFGLSATVVGALMTAVVTSLPELVTTIAAVRRGAMQLAVGGIIGGNTFDTLFLCFSDIAYRDGSLYHAVTKGDLVWLAVGLLMTAILLMGLILRERQGPFRIGTESLAMLVVYGAAVVLQIYAG